MARSSTKKNRKTVSRKRSEAAKRGWETRRAREGRRKLALEYRRLEREYKKLRREYRREIRKRDPIYGFSDVARFGSKRQQAELRRKIFRAAPELRSDPGELAELLRDAGVQDISSVIKMAFGS